MFTTIPILLLSIAVFVLAMNGRTQNEINAEFSKILEQYEKLIKIQDRKIEILLERVEKLEGAMKKLQEDFLQTVLDEETSSPTKQEFHDALKKIEENFASHNEETREILKQVQNDIKTIDGFQKTQHKRLKNLETIAEIHHIESDGIFSKK